jgi:hypothetical protein
MSTPRAQPRVEVMRAPAEWLESLVIRGHMG